MNEQDEAFVRWKKHSIEEGLDHFETCKWHGRRMPINVCDCHTRHAFVAGSLWAAQHLFIIDGE